MSDVKERIKAKLEQARIESEAKTRAFRAEQEEAAQQRTRHLTFFNDVALPAAQKAVQFLGEQGIPATARLIEPANGYLLAEVEMTVGRVSYLLQADNHGGLQLRPLVYITGQRVFGTNSRAITLGYIDGTTVDEFCDVLLDAWDRLGYIS